MAVKSMTGFARSERSNHNFCCTIEIKSVNHRFKDVRFRMSSHLAFLEIPLRKLLDKKVNRGSFDISINYKTLQKEQDKEIDTEKVKRFIDSFKDLNVNLEINPVDFLRQEFIKESSSNFYEQMAPLILEAFEECVALLDKSRVEEGDKLKEVILNHFKEYESLYSNLSPLQDMYKCQIEKKLRERFANFSSEIAIDEPRMLQELLYYLEKLDISEELARITIHLAKAKTIIESSNEAGRELDFLLQELGRETNTTGSKSGLEEISSLVVKMKVQLEKIREQNLNIE